MTFCSVVVYVVVGVVGVGEHLVASCFVLWWMVVGGGGELGVVLWSTFYISNEK